MQQIQLGSQSHQDYIGSMFFAALKVNNLAFSKKEVTVAGQTVTLIHVDGVQSTSGAILNLDLWPRNEVKGEELEGMPEEISDITFRIGYYRSMDENGNPTFTAGKPKWLSARAGGKVFSPAGEKREYQG